MADDTRDRDCTVQQLADQFTGGKYHEVYHLIRKGALEAYRPRNYRVRVPVQSAREIFGPTVGKRRSCDDC